MAQARIKKYQKNYTYAIIGSDITARLLALAINKYLPNASVVYIESAKTYEHFRSSSQWNPPSPIPYLNFFKPDQKDLMNLLSQLLEKKDLFVPLEIAPTTYDEGQLKPFLGFGNKDLTSIDHYAFFNESSHLWLNQSQPQILSHIQNLYNGDTLNSTTVTAVESEGHKISQIILNDTIALESEFYFFTDHPKTLLPLFESPELEATIPAKLRQKISKSKPWSTINLHFELSKPLDLESRLYFLMGSKKEDDVVMGRFFQFAPEGEGPFQASWMSLTPSESIEDVEALGAIIKYMKRQIKRPFPEFFDQVINEKIFIEMNTFDHLDLDLNPGRQVPKWENLFLGSPLLSRDSGWSGILSSLQEIIPHLSSKNEISMDTSQTSVLTQGPHL